jgi:hypothetical protein
VGIWLRGHWNGPRGMPVTPQRSEASVERQPGPAVRPAVQSPAETALLLQALHQQRDYAAIAPLIVADRRGASLDLLMTIDDVLSANDELQEAVRGVYGSTVSGLWDLSAVENNLGPFSARVVVINQSFKGDSAIVTLQEGDNVPLARAHFDWAEDRWQYRPEVTPAQILPELDILARILRDLAGEAKGGLSFEACFDAFAQRVFPQMHRIIAASEVRSETVAVSGAGDSAD